MRKLAHGYKIKKLTLITRKHGARWNKQYNMRQKSVRLKSTPYNTVIMRKRGPRWTKM